jgi:hypothetical protein
MSYPKISHTTPRPFAEPIVVPSMRQPVQGGGERYDPIAKELLKTFRTKSIINEFENRMTYPDFVMYVGAQLGEGEKEAANNSMNVQKYKSTVGMMRDPEFSVALKRVFNNAS